MKQYNLILVYDKNKEKVLMCKREKEPYKEKLNLIGGKIEPNENDLESAYRELNEETGINSNEIDLRPLMNLEYLVQDIEIKVFIGRLKSDIKLHEEINKLIWVEKNCNTYDLKEYAGEGNIWHMIHYANKYIDI